MTWAGSEQGVIVLAGSVGSSYWVTWAGSEQGVIVLAGTVGSSC